MAELAATPPFAGLVLPRAEGSAVLAALPETPRCSIAPFRGRAEAVATAVGGLPEPGRAEPREGGRILWAGLDLWLVEGAEAERLARAAAEAGAAVTDQSDAWAGLTLAGGVVDVLARLAPLDVDPAAFPPGHAARSLLRHIPCLFLSVDGGVEILVPRSYARSAVHDISEAMLSVAAMER